MWINKRTDQYKRVWFVLTFKYDAAIVDTVKSIDGRVFNKHTKNWEIPASSLEDAVRILSPLGFNCHIEVKNARRAQESMRKALLHAKEHATYQGTLPLYEFQKIGAGWMRESPGALLADAPGLGKTLETIAALEDRKGPHLIICPASLKYSWEEEIHKWSPGVSVQVIDDEKARRIDQWEASSEYTYTIANYELLLRDFDSVAKVPWDAVVCDEATRLSNPANKTTRAIKDIRSKKRIALTGTPISNSPLDIWSIIDWVVPGYLGPFSSFYKKYAVENPHVDPRWHKISGYRNLEDLAEKIAPLVLRRTKEEVLVDFPKKTREHIAFSLSAPERAAYRAVQLQLFKELHEMKVEGHNLHVMLVKILRLKQLTDDPRLIVEENPPRSSKLDALIQLLEPVVASGEKAIVFTQFSEMAKLLSMELRNTQYEPLTIYGAVDTEERFARVKAFNDGDENKVLVMTEAGAYGLNLQRATYVIHYDLPWSIAKIQQREDRCHRIGQEKPVTVYSLVAKDSIDEYVYGVLHKKQAASTQVLQDFERLEERGLTEEDIKNILSV